MLKKLKWIIPGIWSNKTVFSVNENDRIFKLRLDSGEFKISRSDFHCSLGSYDYLELIELKRQLLTLNNCSEDLLKLLYLTEIQISRLQSSFYSSLWDYSAEDFQQEYIQLEEAIRVIRRHIIIAHKAHKLELEKFGRDWDHSHNLHSILSGMGSRIHQLTIEDSLPKVDFPHPKKHAPKDWIVLVEEIVQRFDNPSDAAFSVRLKLDRIKEQDILVYRLKEPISYKKPFQFYRNYKLSVYKEKVMKLMATLPGKIAKQKRNQYISELKQSILIKRPIMFTKCIKYLIQKEIIIMDIKHLNWFLYSLNTRSKVNFPDEFPSNLCFINNEKAIRDFRNVIRYFISKGIIERKKPLGSIYKLLPVLISVKSSGFGETSWKNTLSGAEQSSGRFTFESEDAHYLDFINL